MSSSLCKLAFAVLFLSFWGEGYPQAYPSRPITLIVTLSPGSQSDIVARLLAGHMQTSLGQPVVVENRVGADGMIAAEGVSKAAPDGYTLLYAVSGTLAIAPTLYAGKMRYDTEKDLAPIAQVARATFIITASAGLPAANLKQFIDYTRARPRTAALGHLLGAAHLLALRTKQVTGADVALIAYKGPPQIWTDLYGGRIHVGLETLGAAQPQIKAGKLKALAVLGSSRSPLLPEVATVREQGYPEMEGEGWNALLTRAGTPPAIIDRLYREVVRIVALPDVQARLQKAGVEIKTSDPQSLARIIREDTARWGQIIRDFGVKAEN